MDNILRDLSPDFIKMITRNSLLSYDTETTGVNPRKDKIIGFSVSNGEESYYIVHQEWLDGQLNEVVAFPRCQLLLNIISNKKIVMHNAAFDCQMTKNYFGVDLIPALHADTMLMAHTISENRFNYGLKELSAEIFGNDEKAEQLALKEHLKTQGAGPKEFYKANSEILGTYATKDALLTYRLYKHFLPQLHADDLEDFFFNDEVMPLLKHVSVPMMASGIPLDLPYLQETQNELVKIMEELESEIQNAISPYLQDFNRWYVQKNYKFELNARFKQKLGEFMAPALWPRTETGQLSFNASDLKKAKEYSKTELKRGSSRPLLGDSQFEDIVSGKIRCPAEIVQKVQLALMADDGLKYTFNLLSKDHMKRLFFGTTTTESVLNEHPLSTTKKGNPQVDDEFLESIKFKYAWIPLWQRFNSLTKIKGTYVDRFLEEQENGIFYPEFKQHGTTSGRYSGDFQQLNRIMEEGEGDPVVREYNNRIRRFFISGPEHVFADFDYDSQEVKVFAHVSGEQSIKDVFANGDDFYSAVAIQTEKIENVSANKKSPDYLGKVAKERRQRAKAYCLDGDTLLFTNKGYKRIRNVVVGDFVFTRHGMKKVTNFFERESETIILNTSEGILRCTPDHQVLSNNSWVYSEELVKGNKIVDLPMPIREENPIIPLYNFLSKLENFTKPIGHLELTPEWCYIIGAFLGDGVSSYSDRQEIQRVKLNAIGIRGYFGICGLKDDNVVNYFKDFFADYGIVFQDQIRKATKASGDFITYTSHNNQFAHIISYSLKLNKIVADGTRKKDLKVPDYIMNAPLEHKLAFLAGLIDTDGYAKSSGIEICSKAFQLPSDLTVLCKSIGVEACTKPDFNKEYEKNYYKIYVSSLGKEKLKVLGIGKYLRVPRKKDAIENHKAQYENSRRKIVSEVISIETRKDITKVYDITVEDVHEFVASGIVVHNCLGLAFGMTPYKLKFELNCSEGEAQQIYDNYFRAYPKLKQWLDDSKRKACLEGYVRTEAGRIRRFPELKRYYAEHGDILFDGLELWKDYHETPDVYERMKSIAGVCKNLVNNAANVQIQGLAASITNRAAIKCAKALKAAGLTAYICAVTHDQITVRCLDADLDAVKSILQHSMETAYEISVKLTAPPSHGYNLAESK